MLRNEIPPELEDLCEAIGDAIDNISVEPENYYGKPSVRLTFGKMYEPPEMGREEWQRVADYFGGSDVVRESFSKGGSDQSGDWGSNYGYDVYVLNPTKHADLSASWSDR